MCEVHQAEHVLDLVWELHLLLAPAGAGLCLDMAQHHQRAQHLQLGDHLVTQPEIFLHSTKQIFFSLSYHKVIKHLFPSPVIESEGSDSLLLGRHVHLHGVEEDEDVIELYQVILVSVQQRKQLPVPVRLRCGGQRADQGGELLEIKISIL